ncbi:MAG: hypothetical protein KGL53_03125 [Elusimicrobia bacterium]|nr:hypothetical protein [Elusimicrobiota bacterium]
MNRVEVVEWTRRWHGPAVEPILAELKAQLELLTRAVDEGAFFIEFFEAAVNNESSFGRVKLVHVAQFLAHLSSRRKRDLARRRRDSLRELFTRWKLDVRPFDAMYDNVFAHGVHEYYPVASVEWDLAARRFEEVSIYCEPEAPRIAAAIARGLGEKKEGLEKRLKLDRLFAVGYDFRPGKPSRFKLYHAYPVSVEKLKRYASARCYFALPRKFWPAEYLVLKRKTEGQPFEDTRKVYFPYLQRRSMTDGTMVYGLEGACRKGPLKDFLASVKAPSAGQFIDYLGSEGEKIEIYFGKPSLAWGEMEGFGGPGPRAPS